MVAALDHNRGYMPTGDYPQRFQAWRRMEVEAFAGCDGRHSLNGSFPYFADKTDACGSAVLGTRGTGADAGISS
jgi:hypothetical protein